MQEAFWILDFLLAGTKGSFRSTATLLCLRILLNHGKMGWYLAVCFIKSDQILCKFSHITKHMCIRENNVVLNFIKWSQFLLYCIIWKFIPCLIYFSEVSEICVENAVSVTEQVSDIRTISCLNVLIKKLYQHFNLVKIHCYITV